MKMLCKVFGHSHGWGRGAPYGVPEGGRADGIGRQHYRITAACVRCSARFDVARFHGSKWLRGKLNEAAAARGVDERVEAARAMQQACEGVALAETGMTAHGNMDFGPNIPPRILKAIRALDPEQFREEK